MESERGSVPMEILGTVAIALTALLLAVNFPKEAHVVDITAVGILTALAVFVLRSRHIVWLWTLHPSSSISILNWLRKNIAVNGQRFLQGDLLERKARFIALLDKGELTESTYHEQIVFGELFYRTKRESLWATNLDPWSDFLRINESYSRSMEKNAPSLNFSETPQAPPLAGRIFILPADRFALDIVKDPTAARELVRCHFRVWKTYPRLLLLEPDDGPIWDKMLSCCFETEETKPTPSTKIPDFMLVDKHFIYGRIFPEILDEKFPMGRGEFTLGFCKSKDDVDAYENIFSLLWKKSLSIELFGTQLHAALGGPGAPSIDQTVTNCVDAVIDWHPDRKHELGGVMKRTAEDIEDFLGEEKRQVRYAWFYASEQAGEAVDDLFVKKAEGTCFAIDLADIKNSKRFFETWMNSGLYSPWKNLFAQKADYLRRRIFVLRDWQLDNDVLLSAFLVQEVIVKGFEVGLILKEDLEKFAETHRGVDAAMHDAEWIIVNTDNNTGVPKVGEFTIGFNIGSSVVGTNELKQKENLMIETKMNTYLQWHKNIWEDSVLKRILCEDDIHKLKEFVNNQETVRA